MRYIFIIAVVTFLIGCNDPDACFNVDGNEVFLNEEFTFNNCSTESKSWEWDFGDGTSSTEEAPKKTYSTVGDYTVTLTVFNKNKKKSDQQVNVISNVKQSGQIIFWKQPDQFEDFKVSIRDAGTTAIDDFDTLTVSRDDAPDCGESSIVSFRRNIEEPFVYTIEGLTSGQSISAQVELTSKGECKVVEVK